MTRVSILDLAFVTDGAEPADALRHSLDLAQHAEALGYERFWLAEHHNMRGIASAATSVVIGFVAAGTQRIREDGRQRRHIRSVGSDRILNLGDDRIDGA